MGSISTTSFTEPLRYPNQQFIDRENYDGDLWFAKRVSQTQVDIFKSSSNGASWTGPIATFTRANLQEISGLFMDSHGHIHMLTRVYESGTDRIYWMRLPANSTTWDSERFIVGASAGSAGAVYTGMDMVVFRIGTTWYMHAAVGTQNGVNGGITMFSAYLNDSGSGAVNNLLITGDRQWINGPPGVVHPSIDFVHTGDRKTIGANPNLWVAWGRSTIYTARFAYTVGPKWQSPMTNTPPAVSSLSPNQPSNTAVWDAHGSRFLVAWPVSSAVRIGERAADNTTQVQRDTPAHPAGTVKHCSISVSSATSNIRVFAVGTTDNTLYYIDYDRDANAWSASWTQVSAAAIIGAEFNNYNVRRVNFGNGHYDLVIATGSTPFNLISTSSTAASAPRTPSITAPSNGAAQDVASGLTISWTFEDADPSDFQDAYSLRRAIGAGSFQYWNAGTGTWGASDVWNLSGTTSVTIPSGWGADSDANHFYSVKVRDQQGNASPNATNVTVVPSAKANPTITSPTAAPTTATITPTWTVSSQSAYRVQLRITASGEIVRDTGWVTSTATSVAFPDQLTVQSYTLDVTTRNAEGLTSTTSTLVFTPNYTQPQQATLALAPSNTNGLITVSVSNPEIAGSESYYATNTIYRRKVGETGMGVKVATIGPSSPANILAPYNPGFEGINSNANWGTAAGTATAARDTTQFRSGVASFASTAISAFPGINFGPLNTFAALPGQFWYLSFWAKGSVGRNIRAAVGWRTAANGPNNVPHESANFVMDNTWKFVEFTTNAAPANTAFAYPTLVKSPDVVPAGEKVYVDDVTFYKVGSSGGVPSAYNDFMVASAVNYEYCVVTTSVNGASRQSAWFS